MFNNALLSGFELYPRWVPLIVGGLNITYTANDRDGQPNVSENDTE